MAKFVGAAEPLTRQGFRTVIDDLSQYCSVSRSG